MLKHEKGKQRQAKILKALNDSPQTWNDLIKSTKINHDSLAIGLAELKEKKLITKDADNRYYIKSKIKNKMLLNFKGYDTMYFNVKDRLQKLQKAQNPFPLAAMLILDYTACLVGLTFERFAVQRLSYREKDEFDKFIVLCEVMIETVFYIIRKKNPQKTIGLANHLYNIMFDPDRDPFKKMRDEIIQEKKI